MTVLAVVAYPRLEEADRQWIEAIRAKHDPQATRIGVHFTLVFPAEVSPSDVAVEVAAVAQATKPITFTIRRAKAVRDLLGGGAHVFLVPDEGGDEITKLHDQLYQGVLRPYLRANVPFTPHMTVAAGSDLNWCEGLAQELNVAHRTMRSTLVSVELVNDDKPRVESIGSFMLGNAGASRVTYDSGLFDKIERGNSSDDPCRVFDLASLLEAPATAEEIDDVHELNAKEGGAFSGRSRQSVACIAETLQPS